MGEGFYFIDIVIFAMIAGFLVYRLRGVLGRRHGEERQRPNPFAAPSSRREQSDNVVPLPDRGRLPDAAPAERPNGPVSLSAALAQIKVADPSFDEKHFLSGAAEAFRMIVEAYAKGETDTLRPLLSDDVYDSFADAIRKRQEAGETLETQVQEMRDVDIVDARLDGRTIFVTVKFESEQINVTRGADGQVVDGDPEHPLELTELWTFARSTRSKDPNWFLVETSTPS